MFLCNCFLIVLLRMVLSNTINFQTDIFNQLIEPKQVQPLWFRVDLGVIVMKGYFTFHRSPEVMLHHQMQFSVIRRTPTFFGGGRGSYSSAVDIVSVF